MAAKVKVKTIQDKELADIFNQMLGTGKINMSVCYPRYLNIKSYVDKVLMVLDLFNNKSKFYGNFPELNSCQEEINNWINNSKRVMASDFEMDLAQYDGKWETMPEDLQAKFGQMYEDLKKSDIISALIMICDNLIAFKKHLGDSENLSHKFILTLPGVEFCPFPFTKLNFKYVLSIVAEKGGSNNAVSSVSTLVLTVLNKILSITHNLYKVVSTPDVDIDQFVEVVMKNIDEAKKRIPRCNKAFDKLAKSVEMLKDNFPTYYRDFVQSSNSTIIIENFVLDVAKNTKADVELMRQFRQIISYYRKVAAQQVKNPQVKGLLDRINNEFSKFDKFTNIKIDGDGSSDDSDEDEDEEVVETPEQTATREAQERNAQKSVDELVNEIMGGKDKPRTESPKKGGRGAKK